MKELYYIKYIECSMKGSDDLLMGMVQRDYPKDNVKQMKTKDGSKVFRVESPLPGRLKG